MKKLYNLIIHKSKRGKYFWTIKASNGRKVATAGEDFSSHMKCMRSINNLLTAIKEGRIHYKVEDWD